MGVIINSNQGRTSVEQWIGDAASGDTLQQLVKSSQPTYRYKTIYFDGQNDSLEGRISNPFNTSHCCVFFIAGTTQTTGTVVFDVIYGDGNTSGSLNYLGIGVVDGKPTAWYGDGTQNEVIQASTAQDNSYLSIYCFKSNGTTREFFKDGVQIGASNVDLSAVVDTIKIGGHGGGLHSKLKTRSYVAYNIYKNFNEQQLIEASLRETFLIDIAPPATENLALAFSGLTDTSFTVSWSKSTDDVTPRSQITYSVYTSTSNNIGSIQKAEANGTLRIEANDISSHTVDTLDPATYYITVISEDNSGNKSQYNVQSIEVGVAQTDGFVTVFNGEFQVNGTNYKFSGTNAYYLPVFAADNMINNGTYPNTVDDFFTACNDTNIEVIRIWGFYDGHPQFGNDTSIQPEPGVYNEDGLVGLDRVIAKAKDHGVKIVIPFVNYWGELGGIPKYNEWAGELNPDQDRGYKFINGTQQQQWFRDYISMMLNRVNTVTGVAYKDETAIFGWEVCNEFRNRTSALDEEIASDMTRDWYQGIAQHIKSIDTNHLVSTGEEGFDVNQQDPATSPYQVAEYDNTWGLRTVDGTSYVKNIAIAEIDYGSFHLYHSTWGLDHDFSAETQATIEAIIEDHENIAQAQGKPCIMGEYGWSNFKTEMYNFIWDTIEASGCSGDLLWQFTNGQPKIDEYGGNVDINRDSSTVYPDFRAHVFNMSGIADTEPPTISDGLLVVETQRNSELTISFTGAIDNSDTNLTYSLYTSLQDNISTINDCLANGTLKAQKDGVTKLTAIGLSPSTTYFFNIIVSDDSGNKSIYSSGSGTTSGDVTAPGVSDGNLTFSNITFSEFDCSFVKATDNESAQTELVYEIYTAKTDVLTNATNTVQNGTLRASGTDVSILSVSGLILGETYYVNIVVRDMAGNISAYTSEPVTMADVATGEPIYEWDHSGVALVNTNEVDTWTDNVQGAIFKQEMDFQTPPIFDPDFDKIIAPDNEALLGADGMNIDSSDFQISIAVDLTEDIADFRPIIIFAPSGADDGDPGVFGFFTDQLRNGEDKLSFIYNGQQVLPLVTHTNDPAILTIRASGNSVEAIYSSHFGTQNIEVDAISASELIANKAAFNSRLQPTDIPDDFTGDAGVNVIAMRIWKSAGTDADRDSRIQGMKDDYMTAFSDIGSPTVADPVLASSNVNYGYFDVSFTQATDSSTAQSELLYSLYISESDNINTLSEIETNGILVSEGVGISTLRATALSSITTYFYNVIVSDVSGNKTAYTSNSQTTISKSINDPDLHWEPSGVEHLDGDVLKWVDSAGSLDMITDTKIANRPKWDSVNQRIISTDDAQYLFADKARIDSGEFMISFVMNTGEIPDFERLITLAPEGQENTEPGGIYFEKIGFQNGIEAIDAVYSNVQIGNDIEHFNDLCVVTIRASAGSVEAFVDNGTSRGVIESASIADPNSLTERIVWNSDLDATGIVGSSGAIGANIYDISIWRDAGTVANRDSRIENLISTYIVTGTDRQALVDLYNATGGDTWTNNTGWLNGEPSANWHGVQVDAQGRVTSLDLSGNGLTGSIPDSIGYLTELQYLNLKQNQMSGSIPSSIGNMISLTHLLLNGRIEDISFDPDGPTHPGKPYGGSWADERSNNFTGSIPSSIGNLSNLEWLEMAGSDAPGEQQGLTGQVPLSFENLTSLKGINLSYNAGITGLFDFTPLVNLIHIYIRNSFDHNDGQNSALEGTGFPVGIETLSNLKFLWLQDNLFGGDCPDLSALTLLEYTHLSRNDLTGSFPSALMDGTISNITSVSASWNNFTGTLPAFGDNVNLVFFSVNGSSNLGGTLPAGLERQTRMINLGFGWCNFEGEWPADLTGMRNLRHIYANNNNFTGTLPEVDTTNEALDFLYFFSNQMSGEIPASLAGISDLPRISDNDLDVSNNKFSNADLQPIIDALTAKNALSVLSYGGQNPDIGGDTTPPSISDPVLTASNIIETGFDVSFAKATDNQDAQSSLSYSLYTSTSANIDTAANAIANGTLRDSGADIAMLSASGLSDGTIYYFNVVVSDSSGNDSTYTMNSTETATADTQEPPTIPSSGNIVTAEWDETTGSTAVNILGKVTASWDETTGATAVNVTQS